MRDGRTLGVTGAPTRWGKVGYQLKSRLANGEISARVTLPDRPGAAILLRLRAPLGFRLDSAATIGDDPVALAIEDDRIVLPGNATGVVELVTKWIGRRAAN